MLGTGTIFLFSTGLPLREHGPGASRRRIRLSSWRPNYRTRLLSLVDSTKYVWYVYCHGRVFGIMTLGAETDRFRIVLDPKESTV
jgi:hypothetical protein